METTAKNQWKISIACHHDIDQQSAMKLKQYGFNITSSFNVDFYRNLNNPALSSAKKTTYIRDLAQQYLTVIGKLEAGSLCLYHTMNWEHCQALNLALRVHAQKAHHASCFHLVLLMFPCGVNHLGQTTHPLIKMQFRMALTQLAALNNVNLQTNNAEYLDSYNDLLAPERLALHPNIFADFSSGKSASKPAHNSQNIPSIILYMGDIKAEKGFLNLPKRLEQLLGKTANSIVVQYSGMLPDSPAFQHCQQQLQALAARHSQLQLISRFWSQSELHNALSNASLLVMDYNPTVYAEKTSGLLWLAAAYRLPVALNGQSWLNREALRLGMNWTNIDDIHNVELMAFKPDSTPRNRYKQQLEIPFWSWLDNSYHSMIEHIPC